MTWPYSVTPPLVRDITKQDPSATCVTATNNGTTNLLINRDAPPFDNPDLRKALALTIDRKSFIDIMTEGQAKIGAAMLPPRRAVGMPQDMLRSIPGYDPDVQKNREAAREIMRKLGYGPDKKLELKVSTRNVAAFRDPAVIMIDQLKEIYIDAVLDAVETANWFPKVVRKDYSIAINNTGSGVDDPTSNSTKTTRAARSAITAATAIPSSTRIRRAVDDVGPGSAQEAGLGDRQEAAGRRRPADHLPRRQRHVSAIAGQGRDDHGQQHLQRLAHGRRLA